MKKQIISFIFWLSVLALQAQVTVIPQPQSVKVEKGNFQISKSSSITFQQKEAKNVAHYLQDKLQQQTGIQVKVTQHKGNIQLQMLSRYDSVIGQEGYHLTVSNSKILLKANTAAGLFYGANSLLQLIPYQKSNTVSVSCVQITDYPRFAWRGMMLDVSRHFFTKDEVKNYIDILAQYKFNRFHWHLTDDNGWRIEIKSYPKLTEVGAWRVAREGRFGERIPPKAGEKATYGGFYTQADIKEIVQYAKERFVEIIPEIDVPGHSMAAIAAYPELCCTKDTSIKVNPGSKFSDWYGNSTFRMHIDNSLNPSDEKVYAFLDKVLGEVAALFPYEYLHIGGDECYKGFWKNDEGCQALMKKLGTKHVDDLQAYFIGRVSDIVTAKGKKMIGWDEILEGNLPKNATLMFWRDFKGKEVEMQLAEAAQNGHTIIMSPNKKTYFDFYQGDKNIEPPMYGGVRLKEVYEFEPVPAYLPEKAVLGGQANVWTEHIPTYSHVQYMTFPRAWALAEVLWLMKDKKDWNNFATRTEKHFERNEKNNINYAKSVYDAIITPIKKDGELWIEISTELPDLEIYYTTNDAMPTHYDTRYKQSFRISQPNITTLRVITYRNGKPIGNLIQWKGEDLLKRAK
jgi:hexosaminidase